MMTQSGESFDPYYHWLGIPPDEQPPTHYRLLGIKSLEENREVIQNAADRQMVHLRTFQTGPRAALSQKLLNEVSAARVCLLSAEKKKAYDQQLREAAAGTATDPSTSPPFVPIPPAPIPPALSGLAATSPAVNSVEPTTPDVAEDPALNSLFVQTTGSLPVGRSAGRLLPRRRFRLPAMVMAVAGCVLIGAIAVALWPSSADDPPTGNRLVLMWPAAERSAAIVQIDGRRCDLTSAAVVTTDKIELELDPGTHTYRVTRPGAIPLEGRFVLSAGTNLELNISFVPLTSSSKLVLQWAEGERAGVIFEIDGRAVDLAADSLDMDAERITFSLPAGEHTLSIQRDGTTLLSQAITLGEIGQVTVPVELSSTRLYVRWDVAKREGATLLLDGKAVDLQRDAETDRGGVLAFVLPLGTHSLRIQQGDSTLVDQRLELTAGKRTTVNANSLIDRSSGRVWLVWPADERAGATLSVDGDEVALTSDAEEVNEEEIAIAVQRGDHTIKITHPDFEDFEQLVKDVRGDVRLPVTRKSLVSPRPPAEEIERLRKEFEATYSQYDEYKQWSQEADPQKKRSQLESLLKRIRTAASAMARDSSQQYVAFQEAYRLALAHDECVIAYAVLKDLRQAGCCTEKEYQTFDQEVWDKAIRDLGIESLVSYLKVRGADGKRPSESEQAIIVERITQAPEVESDYSQLDQWITTLVDIEALSPAAALRGRIGVYVAAAKASQPGPDRYVALGEEMIEAVPETLERESAESLQQADALLDAVSACRRKAMADRRTTNELRVRADALNEDSKEMRDLISQYSRAVEARQAIDAGAGTATQQKLLGLWLLQRGQFDKALPYLRASGDASLVDIAPPPPESASDLLTLADVVEAESKKSKYSQRNASGMLGYALYLRQLALARSDGTLDENTRTEVEKSVHGPAEELDWKRTPKGKWVKLTDVYAIDTLRQIAGAATAGKWNVLDDGTIVATKLERAMLELPVNIPGSYAIRFVCRRTTGENVNVNLPLGNRSVLFTLGAFSSRFSGLQLFDDKLVSDPKNVASIKRSEFTLRRDAPAHVEIHVELLPVKAQSSKQKKLTGGNDWTTISILIENRLIRRVSAATSRFAMDTNYQLSQDVLGLSAKAVVSYSSIELMRL